MAITDKKISTVYSGRDIASLSDRPNQDGLTAAQLKARFDQLNKELFPNYNELIDELFSDLYSGSIQDGHTHDLDNLVDGITYKLFTALERAKLSAIEENAEVNQNAFSNVKVGSTTIASDSKTDTFELVAGLNVSIAVDSLTKKITLSATGDLATEAVQSYIEDIGNYFTSLNVEGALQEVGANITEIEAQLAQKAQQTDVDNLTAGKIDKNGSGQVTWANAAQDFREQITGGNTAIVADDSVITSNITDNAVTPRKTTFFTPTGKNLFDKTDITEGYYSNIESNGNMSALASYGVSDFIRVLPNTVYTKSITQQMPFFDENKQFISGVDAVNIFTTPANCAYVRINFVLTDKDIVQLELGNAITVYEEYSEKVDDKYLGEAGKLKYIPSKNLFDKSKAIEGWYVGYTTGRRSGPITGYYASDYIPVIAGQTYTKNDAQQFAYYDANKQYVSGVETATTFTVPPNVSFARFSVRDSGGFTVDTFQVEKGSVSTSYEPYREVIYGIDSTPSGRGIVTVGKQGADFTSIEEALNSTGGDISIIVLQGTYYEHLDINAATRKVSIIGVDVENTIIRDDSGDYYKAPLNANGNIYFENVTFLSTHDDGTDYDIPAYAVHLDRAGAGVATFRNCKMVSYQSSAIGIGTHQDQTIILDNCEIIKLSERDGGALFVHNAPSSNVTNQKLIAKNCIIKTNVGFAIKVDDANTYNGGTNSPMDITFQFNILDSGTRSKDQRVWYRDAPIDGGVSGQIKLTSDSFGNNDIKIND